MSEDETIVFPHCNFDVDPRDSLLSDLELRGCKVELPTGSSRVLSEKAHGHPQHGCLLDSTWLATRLVIG